MMGVLLFPSAITGFLSFTQLNIDQMLTVFQVSFYMDIAENTWIADKTGPWL